MAYSSGGLIAATDFNGLAQTNSSNVAYTWGVGSARYGWGQSTTLLTGVASLNTVTATQWAGLIYTINKAIAHQGVGTQLGGGTTGANINAVSGATITYFANVSTAVTNLSTLANANVYTTQGTTITGTGLTNNIVYADSAATYTTTITRTATFASGDAARYFFNAGGQLNLVATAVSNNATGRSADYVTLFQTNLNSITIRHSASSWNGTDSNASPQNSTLGYWNQNTSSQLVANVRSAGSTYLYWSDYVSVGVKTNGVQGTNGDNGSVITFTLITSQPSRAGSFNNAVNVTVTTRIDVVPPETTYLANSWGSVTIA